MKRYKILIVKLGAVGDIVMASTMIKEARRIYENPHITWLCGEDTAELVNTFKGVDEVITINNAGLARGFISKVLVVLKSWRKLFGKRFDLVVTAYSDPRYFLLTFVVIAGERRRFDGKRALISNRYHGTEYARLINGKDDNITDEYPLAGVSAGINPRGGMVLLAAGGAKNIMCSNNLRRWHTDCYVELAKNLIAEKIPVGIIGSRSDLWVEEAFRGLDVTSYVGKTSISELMLLIGRARAVVSHDSGAIHITYLMGTPLVSVFGATSPASRLPAAYRSTALSLDLPCVPCYDGKNYAKCSSNICMQGITPEMVIKKII